LLFLEKTVVQTHSSTQSVFGIRKYWIRHGRLFILQFASKEEAVQRSICSPQLLSASVYSSRDWTLFSPENRTNNTPTGLLFLSFLSIILIFGNGLI
jgi:hypothetical protein